MVHNSVNENVPGKWPGRQILPFIQSRNIDSLRLYAPFASTGGHGSAGAAIVDVRVYLSAKVTFKSAPTDHVFSS